MFSKMTFVWRVLGDSHCVGINSGEASFALASNSTIMISRLVVIRCGITLLPSMLCHHKFYLELLRCIFLCFNYTCIKSTAINCFAKSVKSSEYDVQNTCSKDPICVSNCLLNLDSTVIKVQVKSYNCFPVWTNTNSRYTMCQHQYSVQS